jgi:site-specific DNA-methyltransferase (adenine-specific)
MELTNEDNMELMARYEDNHFDLAIVDPPYRDENQPDQWLRANSGDMKKWEKTPTLKYYKELFRVSKNQIIWGGNYFTKYLEPNNNWLIWYKMNDGVHFSMCEMAWSSIRKNIKLLHYFNSGKKKIHPTQKPVKLYEWILMGWAKEGDKILDTHLGSGSIAIACHNLGYDLTACELDKEYYNAAIKRINEHKQQIRMF